jgi:L-cysteine desulfidase
MGVGISLVVDGSFEKVQQSVEKMLGKALKDCSTSDGMHSCELKIAEQRTVVLMAGDSPKSTNTLVGCYYLYEK